MGSVTAIMSGLTLAAQVLVLIAILAGIVAILDGFRQRFAVMRALGAASILVFSVVWTYVATLLIGGAAVGLLLGWGLAALVSSYVSTLTGVATRATIAGPEFVLVGSLVLVGLVLALVPAALAYRRPVVEGLRA